MSGWGDDVMRQIACMICYLVVVDNSQALYCAFDIFQKVVFYLGLYTEEVNLQTFLQTICRNYLRTKSFIVVIV